MLYSSHLKKKKKHTLFPLLLSYSSLFVHAICAHLFWGWNWCLRFWWLALPQCWSACRNKYWKDLGLFDVCFKYCMYLVCSWLQELGTMQYSKYIRSIWRTATSLSPRNKWFSLSLRLMKSQNLNIFFTGMTKLISLLWCELLQNFKCSQ